MRTEKKLFTKASSDAGYNIGVKEEYEKSNVHDLKVEKKEMECDVV